MLDDSPYNFICVVVECRSDENWLGIPLHFKSVLVQPRTLIYDQSHDLIRFVTVAQPCRVSSSAFMKFFIDDLPVSS